jgi:hypothetical protein
MTSINKDKITSHAAAVSISFSFFIAVFGCSFAHGQQQEDHTTSITAFGKLPTSTPRLIFTSLSQPIPPTTNNVGQQQEQIIGSDLVVPSPSPSLSPSPNLSLPMDRELNDRQRLQPQEEQKSETQLTAQEEQSQLLPEGGSLKDPRAQSKLMDEEKEKAELEIKQRLDGIGAGEEDDREVSERRGAGDEGNNREDTSGDSTNDNEAPLDLKLPVPFP